MALTNYGRTVGSVFDLAGRREVHLTAALGWTLEHSPAMTNALWSRLGLPAGSGQVAIALEVTDESGRSDLEMSRGGTAVVIEAKKGWLVPGEAQLTRYTNRLESADVKLLVSLSDSSGEWATNQLPRQIAGVPVTHISWDDIRGAVRSAWPSSRTSERLWLTELTDYLSGATAVRDPSEQWVYCVVVSNHGTSARGGTTYRDFVQAEHVYFHPFGGNNHWPKRPPVLLAFRWGGRVRQINRVLSHQVYPNLQCRWPDIEQADSAGGDAHIVYELGPDLPIPVISTQGTYANARVWALLDQMLTKPTLKEAVSSSRTLTGTAT